MQNIVFPANTTRGVYEICEPQIMRKNSYLLKYVYFKQIADEQTNSQKQKK